MSPVIYPQTLEGDSLCSVKVRVFFETFTGVSHFYVQVREADTGDLINSITVHSPTDQAHRDEDDRPAIGAWVDVIIKDIELIDHNAAGVKVYIKADAGAGLGATYAGEVVCYVAAVQFAKHGGDVPAGYYEYSGANALWHAGVRALRANAVPLKRYTVDVDDLTRGDEGAYPFDALVLGQTIRLTDPDLTVRGELLRIIGVPLRDYLKPLLTQLQIATRAQLLSEFLSGSPPANAPVPPSIGTTPPPTAPPQPPNNPPPGPPGGGGVEPAVIPLPIVDGADETVMLEQPEDETDYWPTQRPWYDASVQAQVRVIADVVAAGVGASELVLLYSATPDDAESYASPAGTDVAVTLGTVGPQRGGWHDLIDAAKADVGWTIRARNGDSAETPIIGKAHAQFRKGVPTEYDRLYWRTGAPAVAPTEEPYVGPLHDVGCDPALTVNAYLTPTPADVVTDAGRLLRAKGNDEDGIVPTSADEHADVRGPVLRFVSPPLAAQAFDGVPWTTMCTGLAPSANTTGYVSVVINVYRPSTDTIVAYGRVTGFDQWFRFIARARIISGFFEAWDGPSSNANRIPNFETEEGDRLILDVGTGLRTACGFLAQTEGTGAWIQYNGGTDSYTHQELVSFTDTASYLDLPTWVQFTSDEA